MSITTKIAAISLAALTMGAVLTAGQAQARGWGVGLGVGLGVGALVGAAAASSYGPYYGGPPMWSPPDIGPAIGSASSMPTAIMPAGPAFTDRLSYTDRCCAPPSTLHRSGRPARVFPAWAGRFLPVE
jgi:drug/metabolite transporter (DMT)-like permease